MLATELQQQLTSESPSAQCQGLSTDFAFDEAPQIVY